MEQRPFYERWKMLEKEVIDPRNHEKARSHIYRYDLEPFRVRYKKIHATFPFLYFSLYKLFMELLIILSPRCGERISGCFLRLRRF
jgi:hypothetical protein